MSTSRQFSNLKANPEFQAALVRLMMWVVGAPAFVYGVLTGFFHVTEGLFWPLLWGLPVLFGAQLASVVFWPDLPGRRPLWLVLDSVLTGVLLLLTEYTINPFFLLFLWISVSYGARYRVRYLNWGTVTTSVSYLVATVYVGAWSREPITALLYLLFIVAVPQYLRLMLGQLHEACWVAEESSRVKIRFLATMTHELRTPLSSVIGMGHLLKATHLDSRQQEYLASLDSSVRVLKTLIGDILDVSKIEAGRLHLESVPFVIRDTVRDVCQSLMGDALDKGVELTCRFEPDVPEVVRGDELRVRQILYNLLGNAVKFTDEGGVGVRVRCEGGEAGRMLRLEVRDTGIGMAPDKLEHIFDAFEQVDDSTTRRYGGSGLGTTIARELARLMGGEIGVESVEGRGSMFWVDLPLSSHQEQAERLVFPEQLEGLDVMAFEPSPFGADALRAACHDLGIRCNCVRELRAFCEVAGSAHPYNAVIVADSPLAGNVREALKCAGTEGVPSRPVVVLYYVGRHLLEARPGVAKCLKPYTTDELAAALLEAIWSLARGEVAPRASRRALSEGETGGPSRRILLAEDNALIGKIIQTLLTNRGHMVERMENGRAALEAALETSYDLVLADVRMPEMDGIEFTRRYRQQEKPGVHLPIIALTANAAEEVRAQCLDAGMDAFVIKPVEPEKLYRIVERYVGKAKGPSQDEP